MFPVITSSEITSVIARTRRVRGNPMGLLRRFTPRKDGGVVPAMTKEGNRGNDGKHKTPVRKY